MREVLAHLRAHSFKLSEHKPPFPPHLLAGEACPWSSQAPGVCKDAASYCQGLTCVCLGVQVLFTQIGIRSDLPRGTCHFISVYHPSQKHI